MANGHPSYGGTESVPLLDIGQVGGTRAGAGHALFSGKVFLGPDEARSVFHRAPQRHRVYQDILGFGGGAYTWIGTVRTDTAARLRAMLSEMNQYRHASLRDPDTGVLGAVNMVMLRPTRLTDYDGGVLSASARISGWRPAGRRFSNSEWGAIMPIAISFVLLG